MNIANLLTVKLMNRVLSDYPMARNRLGEHAGKTVSVQIGPIDAMAMLVRITADGNMEMVGIGASNHAQTDPSSPPDVAFVISPS